MTGGKFVRVIADFYFYIYVQYTMASRVTVDYSYSTRNEWDTDVTQRAYGPNVR